MTDLRDLLLDEVGTISSSGFKITFEETDTVPLIEDTGITYPNFDTMEQKCKLIETCILFIDIRSSTQLNLTHHRETMAKLYSAFTRSMIWGAECFSGKVRDIVGDRVMVVFDRKDCFVNAVYTGYLLNSIAQYILNKKFPYDDVKCGIGIDYGKMLVAKTGVIKYGAENSTYKSLVWLGRPANIASKLTDQANKDGNLPILVTQTVFEEFSRVAPPSDVLWYRHIVGDIGYTGDIYGSNGIFPDIVG